MANIKTGTQYNPTILSNENIVDYLSDKNDILNYKIKIPKFIGCLVDGEVITLEVYQPPEESLSLSDMFNLKMINK